MRYSTQQLEHFYHVRHAGKLNAEDPYIKMVQRGTPEGGNVIRFYLEIRHNIIVTARFLAYGSVATISCCEYACRYLQGKTPTAAQQLDAEQIIQGLALARFEGHIATLVVCVLREIIQGFKNDRLRQ